jgi:uncharacterized protein (TIGR02145 family)
MRIIASILLILFSSINIVSQTGEKRLALVIGNGNYLNSVLANPENDARSMTDVLRKLGFTVYPYENLNASQMKRAIDDFGAKLKSYNVGLFYYAGHGIQAKGYNYLIPVDALLQTEEQVEYDCVRADRVLSLMETSGTKVNVIILDACRNNPFERSWTRSATGRGLAFMNAPSGTLIAYSTAPGNTALDGSGKNSPYTMAIMESIRMPNITIIQMFQNVRNIVSQKTNKQQIPWESTSLTGDFYFNESGDSTLVINNQIPISSDDELNASESSDYFIDSRDGHKYTTVKIGKQIWMAENLNFETSEGESWCYGDTKYNCMEYGRLYPYYIAKDICPSGWHLPSDDEWKSLEINLGMSENEANILGYNKASMRRGAPLGEKLLVDTSEFHILLAGFCQYVADIKSHHFFRSLNEEAFFWTSTRISEDSAIQRIVVKSSKSIVRSDDFPLRSGFSVRCLRD